LALAATAVALATLLVVDVGGVNPWQKTEWLISYDGGFVRRGLAGTMFALMHTYLGFDADVAVTVVAYALFVAVGGLLLVRIWRSIGFDTLTVVICLFLPSLVFFPAMSDGLGRKEALFVLVFAANLMLVERVLTAEPGDRRVRRRRYATWGMVTLNAMGMLVALSHEGILLLAVPASVLVTARAMEGGVQRAHRRASLFWLPTVIAGIPAVIWHGDPATADAICRRWMARGVLSDCLGDPASGIGALGWSFGDIVAPAARPGGVIGALVMWGVLLGLCTVLLAVVTARVITVRSPGRGSDAAVGVNIRVAGRYLVLPLLAALPLFVTTSDWGRWFFVASMNYVLVLTSSALVEREAATPSSRWAPSRCWVTAAARAGHGLARSSAAWVLALYVSLAVRVPSCCARLDALPGHLTKGLLRAVVDAIR
jgi:hypothetical protein